MTKKHTRTTLLALSALGIVFGDIGTSPLYALQIAFQSSSRLLDITETNVLGVVSLIVWSLMLVVTIKFVLFIMRADNEGEGGILALVALIKNSRLLKHYKVLLIGLGIIGVSLFYGDSVITPAISVLSAVEGLRVVAPELDTLVVPITLVIILGLFWIQKYGTGRVGALFGPVMLLWFAALAAGGAWQISHFPHILWALSPLVAASFFLHHFVGAFLAMSAVVLAITGAEALYADMGQFGRKPISYAWFAVVFPALLLSYLGQGAILLHSGTANALLVRMYPGAVQIPVIMLSAVATVIASQAVITGAFSLTKQAIQLEFLPKLLVRHTSSTHVGQIYIPLINFLLGLLVTSLVLIFGSSERLAGAYGIAVSGTLLADTILFLVVLHVVKQRSRLMTIIVGICFVPVDLLFISSSLPKALHGGLFPIVIGAFVYLLITTWIRGEELVDSERKRTEGLLEPYIAHIKTLRGIKRVPGTAIIIGNHPGYTPLALRTIIESLHELPQRIIIVSVESVPVAHLAVDDPKRFELTTFHGGIEQVTLRYGFHDGINVPERLREAKIIPLSGKHIAYFVSLSRVVPSARHNLIRWRKEIYCFLSRNAPSVSDYYGLPARHTDEIVSLIHM